MATYIVNAPNRHIVNVSCPLGSFQFNHASYMFNDAVARFFPNIFTKISDDSPIYASTPPEVAIENLVVEPPTAIPVEEPVLTTPPVAAAPAPIPEVKVRKKPGPKPKVKVA